MNDPLDLEPMNPVPVPGYEGFYYFPLDKRIAVSYTGVIIRVSDGKVYKHQKVGKKRSYIAMRFYGKQTNYLVHRVLGGTFIGRPPRHLDKKIENLEINHVDGNQDNNSFDNLEWVTGKENVQHAFISGLHPRQTAVIAKNVITNEESKYRSLKECSDFFKINHLGLRYHLVSKTAGKKHFNHFIFKYDDGLPWPEYKESELTEYKTGSVAKAVVVTNITLPETHKTKHTIFESISQAAHMVGCSKSNLSMLLKEQIVVEKYPYQIKYLLKKDRVLINN